MAGFNAKINCFNKQITPQKQNTLKSFEFEGIFITFMKIVQVLGAFLI
jgi:hypothetical protein